MSVLTAKSLWLLFFFLINNFFSSIGAVGVFSTSKIFFSAFTASFLDLTEIFGFDCTSFISASSFILRIFSIFLSIDILFWTKRFATLFGVIEDLSSNACTSNGDSFLFNNDAARFVDICKGTWLVFFNNLPAFILKVFFLKELIKENEV